MMAKHELHGLRFHPEGGGGAIPSIRPLGAPAVGVPKAAEPVEPPRPKIQAFQQSLGGKRHEDSWARTPNTPGTGAIHLRSFHSRLSDDALTFLDQQVNEWLDAHPQYEVKFVNTSIGEFQGKMGKEPHLVVNIWV